MFWFLWPWSIWDLSSLTRDQTCTPALEGDVLPTGSPETSLRKCNCTSGSYDTWIGQNWINRSSLMGQASLVTQTVKNLPAIQETWVWSLGWEDPLEKEMTATSEFLPGEFHRQRTTVHEVVDTAELILSTSLSLEGYWPLHCSVLGVFCWQAQRVIWFWLGGN